jgi:hypothetical protein
MSALMTTPLCPCGEPLDDTPCWRDSVLECPDCESRLCGRRCLREHVSKNHRELPLWLDFLILAFWGGCLWVAVVVTG